jgi:hypothetical protein
MKKILFVLFAVVLFGCSGASSVQNFRFAGETESHQFNLVQNSTATTWTLFIDGKEILHTNDAIFRFEATETGDWNGKKIVLERVYNMGFLGIGKSNKFKVIVNGEIAAQFQF